MTVVHRIRHRRNFGSMLFRIAAIVAIATSLGPGAAWGGGTPATGTVADQLVMITGSGSKTEDGDYTSANDGIDTYHSFFVEVPEGATRLVIELYDMDVLFGIDGGTNTEQVAERDRIRDYANYLADTVNNDGSRVFYTIATYQLFDPTSAAAITTRFTGSHFAPSDADGAWLTFYDSNTADTSGGDTFRDNFDTVSYSNNDGTQNFATDWIESQETGSGSSPGPVAGLLRVVDSTPLAGEIANRLRITDQGDFPDLGREPAIERELDLSAYTSATLSFDFTTASTIEKPDSLVVEMSSDGGTTWTVIDDFSGYEAAFSGTRNYDITAFISNQTRVRFRVENLYAGSNEALHIDNFEIAATATAAAAPAAGHWEVRIDMSSTVAQSGFNGDETNAFGIRAHDGDATAGGTEYHVYTHHFTSGVNPNDSGRNYTLYPYITNGCEFDLNDFDWDSDLPSNVDPDPDIDPPFGTLSITSPDGSFTNNSTLSGNDVWASATATGWTDETEALQYGIWTMPFRVEDPIDGNYAPMYIGEDGYAGAPPTASPEADTARIYLPTDAGTAPAKAYLYQGMTTFVSEPNPPVLGETALYTVTVGIVNPDGANGDLDFDTGTNVVTANVPAGPTYRGVVTLDQGSIVSQPTLNGTAGGDIVWNAGTVTAGSGADNLVKMAYQLEVDGQTPPYTVDITAAPGTGNGTRATWLDETNTAYSSGELCNMQLISAMATPVVISDFAASHRDGRTELRWSTASEAGTLGFDVLRQDRSGTLTKVNRGPLSAQLGRPEGGHYRLLDPQLPAGATATYWLLEQTSAGHGLYHGPFEIDGTGGSTFASGSSGARGSGVEKASFAKAGEPDLGTPDFDSRPHAMGDAYLERLAALELSKQGELSKASRIPTGAAPIERVKIRVDQTGIQRVSASALADAFGVDVAEITPLLGSRGLRLALGGDGSPGSGETVAWLASPRSQGLEFYGRAADTPYTDTRTYWLERGTGLTMRRDPVRKPVPDWGSESFVESSWIEENTRPVTVLDLDPESDNWFWEFVRHGTAQESRDYGLPVPAPLAPTSDPDALDTATLRVHLQGGSRGEHRVEVLVDDQSLGEVAVVDSAFEIGELDLPAELLVDGDNTVRLRATAGDLIFVEGFELIYDRQARASADRLALETRAGAVATVEGFSGADIRVLDVSQPERPTFVRARILPEDGTFRAIWAQDGSRPYVLASEAGLIEPAVVADTASDLRASHHQVDGVIIAPESLVASALQYAAHHAPERTMKVVSLDDVYDEFSGGDTDPWAIRRFLAHAHSQWTEAPLSAILLGHGTYDFRDFWGLGDNLLPPVLWSRGDSLFPTDAPYGDFDGDGVPEVVIGRVPALTPTEAADYLAKMQVYEAAGNSDWAHRFLMLADFADGSGNFAATSEDLAALLPYGFESEKVHLDEAPDVATARLDLQTLLADGSTWMHWSGHGGIDRLSSSVLLGTADLPVLTNEGRLPVLSAISCTIGLHALPGLDSLAEDLVLADTKGVIAAFAPAWLSEHAEADRLGDRLFRAVFEASENGDSPTDLATVVRRALSSAAILGLPVDVLYGYQLLGDPSQVLHIYPDPPPATCHIDCGGRG